MTVGSITLTPRHWIIAIVAIALMLGAVWAIARYVPVGVDWEVVWRPAIDELVSGRNPHNLPEDRFLNTTWILIPFIPLTWLSLETSWGIFVLIAISSFAIAAYRLGATPASMGFFMTSPVVLHCLLNGNIDWIPLLGFGLPPQIGLFFVLAKPQMGFVMVLLWAWQAWKRDGWRELVRVFGPVTVALCITFALYGFWFLKWANQSAEWWNASLFPYSIPFGLFFAYRAFRTDDQRYAMPASPCLSPYLLFHSWVGALAALLKSSKWTGLAVFALWGLVIFRGLTAS